MSALPVTDPMTGRDENAAVVGRALAEWGVAGAQTDLVAARENHVYRVQAPDRTLALRLHRSGYRSAAELDAELRWMAALTMGGLAVPAPVPLPDGRLWLTLGGRPVDMLNWVTGQPMGRDGRLSALADPQGAYRQLGARMAHLHDLSDRWPRPSGFSRPDWNRDGLLGAAPLWGRFWENPLLSGAEAALLAAARDHCRLRLETLAGKPDYGLIHADLVPENVVLTGDGPALIDFDDGGFGYRLFDLATTLNRTLREEDSDRLGQALIAGYLSRRPLDLTELPLFQALRAFTYVGWIVPRLHEPGAAVRAARSITLACTMARDILAR